MSNAQLAENNARLNVELEDLIIFFESAEIQEHSIANMKDLIEKGLISDCLDLAEGFGKCMAFINHEELLSKMLSCYSVLIDGIKIERKMTGKKLGLLREDKKADPEILAKVESQMENVEKRLSAGKVEHARLQAMSFFPMDKFKDPKFDYKKAYKTEKQRIKELLDPKAQYLKQKQVDA